MSNVYVRYKCWKQPICTAVFSCTILLYWCLIYLCHMLFTEINAAAATQNSKLTLQYASVQNSAVVSIVCPLINIETVSCPCNTCFWYALALAVRKYLTRRSRVTYFLQPARERIKNTYCMGKRPFLFLLLIYMRFLTIFYAKTTGLSFIADYDSERVCHGGVILISVRPMGSTPFKASYYAWTLMNYWLLFTFSLNIRCHGNHL